jgi:hypothetical protein
MYALRRLKPRAKHLYGIDPIWIGREDAFQDDKITTIGGFAETIDLKKMGIDIDVVLCSHTLEHVSEPAELVRKLVRDADEQALFFFQFPGLESLVQDCRFDQVFHQHLNYFSLQSVRYMLETLGAELIRYEINPYHWGALMFAFRKKRRDSMGEPVSGPLSPRREEITAQFEVFKDCMSVTSRRLRALQKERIYGYGAALMLPVLDYHLEDGLSSLIGILDSDPKKIGKYYLNVPVQVMRPDEVRDIQDCVVMLTAINSLDPGRKIIPKLMQLNVKQVIVPVNSI